ncbi:MAG: HAD-IIIA family hydrolase [Verrucomicrobiota bacterium]
MSETTSNLNWSNIKLFAMDVDGVLTDAGLYLSETGEEQKKFSIVDGLGLVLCREEGIELAWISGRMSGATTRRANELKIPHLVQGHVDKISALKAIIEQLGVTAEETVYMGDDTIDASAIAHAGIGVAVPEAQDPALEAANYITKRSGGNGAVREVCNLILQARS